MKEQEKVCTGGEMWPQNWPHSNCGQFKKVSIVRAKSDARYWTQGTKLFRHSRKSGGAVIVDDHYSVRIAFNDGKEERRERFNTDCTDKKEAAKVAAKIYQKLEREGWKATLTEFKPGKLLRIAAADGKITSPTVGEFIAAASSALDGASSRSVNDYCRAFRQIVAAVAELDSDKSRFDHKGGGAKKWREKVDSVPLAKITPAGVQSWKVQFVKRAAGNPVAERSAKISANTMIRQARSLFSDRPRRNQAPLLSFVRQRMLLPSPLPFEGVGYYERQSMRYHSRIDADALLRQGYDELAENKPEAFKMLVLALWCGLRRNEIDKLTWAQVDLHKGLIRIEATRHFKAKSEDSIGEVDLDPKLVGLLRAWKSRATGEFVIESETRRRTKEHVGQFYRALGVYDELSAWLRSRGVNERKPLHTLRKEHGSLVAHKYGIYQASRALRHADISVTAQYYLDKKERLSLDIGAFLKPDNVEEVDFSGQGSTPDATEATPDITKQA